MSIDVVRDRASLAERLDGVRAGGRTVGLVPTMGALHEGHASLVRRAVEETDHVVTSIFVNPIQFGPGEDLGRYPSTPEADIALLGSLGCRTAYAPPVEEMYPEGFCTRVGMTGLTDVLCGATRPGHFSGVLTVVLKLLQQARPDRAYFGQKDYQQFRVIDRMVRDLDVPVALVMCPIVREPDGLALSSRNAYLTERERSAAPMLRRALLAADEAFRSGGRDPAELIRAARALIEQEPPLVLEYLELRDPDDLGERAAPAREGDLVAVAARLGMARLIDNLLLGRERA